MIHYTQTRFETDVLRALLEIIENQGKQMADFSRLNDEITVLSQKVDALLAAHAAAIATPIPPAPAVVDDQPAVDSAIAQLAALVAKIP
jgi:hypothetical protein